MSEAKKYEGLRREHQRITAHRSKWANTPRPTKVSRQVRRRGLRMDHNVLKEKIRKSFMGPVPIDARESWGEFVRNHSTSYFLRYDWIKDKRLYDWIRSQDAIDFEDGTEGIRVFIVKEK